MGNDEFALDVVQAGELKFAFQRNGWTNADVKSFCGGDMAGRILPFVRGLAEINIVKHLIDLDADPFIPQGWSVVEHKKGGQFEWDPTKVRFHLSPNQQNRKTIQGHNLRKELEGQPVFNANLLDYLLKNKQLIPEEWKKDEYGNTRYIFFWGTIYRSASGGLYVRFLYWDDGEWSWDWNYLGHDWNSGDPAAVRAS